MGRNVSRDGLSAFDAQQQLIAMKRAQDFPRTEGALVKSPELLVVS